MNFENLEIKAFPVFTDVSCPKDKTDMLEIENSFFSICWYCEKCDAPYTIRLVKMKKVNRDNLNFQIEKAKARKNVLKD